MIPAYVIRVIHLVDCSGYISSSPSLFIWVYGHEFFT